MSGFFRALPFVLEHEGGFVDDPVDRGGATNQGVTQATYDRWRKSVGQAPRPVKEIATDEVQAVYHRFYWVAAKCDALPWPLSIAHFDAAVNHGVKRAARILQEALKVDVDGIVGPETIGAANTQPVIQVFERMLWRRLAFYHAISKGDQSKFLRGWLRRVLNLKEREWP